MDNCKCLENIRGMRSCRFVTHHHQLQYATVVQYILELNVSIQTLMEGEFCAPKVLWIFDLLLCKIKISTGLVQALWHSHISSVLQTTPLTLWDNMVDPQLPLKIGYRFLIFSYFRAQRTTNTHYLYMLEVIIDV